MFIVRLCCLCWCACLFAGFAGCQQKTAAEAPFAGEFQILAEDSLELHGWFTPSPQNGPAPLVVMLPMRGSTHESYDTLIAALKRAYRTDTTAKATPLPHLLTLDLRGHGKSTTRDSATITYHDMDVREYQKIPGDVARVIEYVIEKLGSTLDTGRITIVGASIGANAAIMTTNLLPCVEKVVLLSPGTEYRGMRPGEAFARFTGETLLVCSRGDTYSFESCQMLAREKNAGWLLKAYPGAAHGTTLPAIDPIAMHDVVAWVLAED